MAEINIIDSRGRDAVVNAESVTIATKVRWVDAEGGQASSRKILRATQGHDMDRLIAEHGDDLDKISDALVAGDPEIDMEKYGLFLKDASRVYTGKDGKIVHKLQHWEIVRGVDGEKKERRPRKQDENNVSAEIPVKWTGKMISKEEACRKMVFSGKMQITHVNGLTYDFLFNMAKELNDAGSLLLVGGGPKGKDPLVFRRGGTAYRGFLEGRVDGDQYALILHLSNMELKKPEEPEEAS